MTRCVQCTCLYLHLLSKVILSDTRYEMSSDTSDIFNERSLHLNSFVCIIHAADAHTLANLNDLYYCYKEAACSDNFYHLPENLVH